MHSYTWLQAIRVLAGLDPGHPYLPSTTPPIPECDPPRVKELLADGVATVEGIPHDGDLHEPIPAAAWRRIKIEFHRSETKERPLLTVARLPGRHVPDLTASRMWYDLLISAEGLGALQASAQRFAPAMATSEVQIRSDGGQKSAAALVHVLVAIADAADQIAALNPPNSPERILARLRRSIERGSLKADAEVGTDGPGCVLASDLGGWCYRRGLVCSDEWEPLQPTDDDVPLDQQTAVYVPVLDAADWVAHYADDAAECLVWAFEREIKPRLQRGELHAIGRKDCTGEAQVIPSPHRVDSECFFLDPNGGRLRPEGRPQRGICWDRVKVCRDAVLRLWPLPIGVTLTTADGSGASGSSAPKLTLNAERDCRGYLKQLMSSGSDPEPKEAVWLRCQEKFGPSLSGRAFDRAWANAAR